jgi:tyrosinase
MPYEKIVVIKVISCMLFSSFKKGIIAKQCKRYWDWSLDSDNFLNAPVWDTTLGFGGNGHTGLGEPVLDGYCVDSGLFANTSVPFLNFENTPHCLARGFVNGSELEDLSKEISPAALKTLFQIPDYNSFNLALENGPHNVIPHIIRGDFSVFTAPSGMYPALRLGTAAKLYPDPLFFLHHTQLDRLWWKWQTMDLPNRLNMYEGLAAHKTARNASIEDVIPMGGLAPDARVKDIMDVQAGILCYCY